MIDGFNRHTFCISVLLVIDFFYNPTDSGAVDITESNLDSIIASNELVFLNFYADWCQFSRRMQPEFDDAADQVKAIFPEPGRVVMGKVDCVQQPNIASKFRISKYPTLKTVLHQNILNREYRGGRSRDKFVEFINKTLVDPINELNENRHINQIDPKKRIIVGYFESKNSSEYKNFKKIANLLKDDCGFYSAFGDVANIMRPNGQNIIMFRPEVITVGVENEEIFTGNISNLNELKEWANEKCISLVREITFENAEELTEEGLPFLILFYDPDYEEPIKHFKSVVYNELKDERQNCNFLTANGLTFAHPLHHLGKSKKDLPLIAIDSFRHMYLFPDFNDLGVKGKLKSFLEDLKSGKLHREYHYGPATDSTFKKLAPSKQRYTFLKDEL